MTKIAHFGTFDVQNFGDLLFPYIAEWRFRDKGVEWVHVSPAGEDVPFEDCCPTLSFKEACGRANEYDAVLLGGGALVHGSPANLETYEAVGLGEAAYPGLWLAPSLISVCKGIPSAWNRTGVAGLMPQEAAALLRSVCSYTNYLSVRDKAGKELLEQSGVTSEIEVGIDTVIEVAEIWNHDELEVAWQALLARHEVENEHDRWICFHFRTWYNGQEPAELARWIERICEVFDAKPILLGIGNCHGDDDLIRKILAHLKIDCLPLSNPQSIREIVAAISRCEAYLGSSLHGAITACSFGVKTLVVAPGNRHKFNGFLEQVGLEHWQTDSWAVAAALAEELRVADPNLWKNILANLRPTLDQHWQKLEEVLLRPSHSKSENGSLIATHLIASLPPKWIQLAQPLSKIFPNGKSGEAVNSDGFENVISAWTVNQARVQHLARLEQKASRLAAMNNRKHETKIRQKQKIDVSVPLPKGRKQKWKWISKILRGKNLPIQLTLPRPKIEPPKKKDVGIVIPIFNAYSDVRRCLASVIRHTNADQAIYCLDDGSTDVGLLTWLEDLASAHSNIRLISHPIPQGYTANINLGCRIHPNDVILLNSDTCVSRGWLRGLIDAAYHRHDIATVTPLSNAAGAFSVPDNLASNEIPEHFDADDMAKALIEIAAPDYPEVPTGNGYCLYVRREAFERLGDFDITNFPVGYGEENDFCCKARKAGYANIIADNVYVYHRRTASFGTAKKRLMERAEARLNYLHPEYGREVRDWLDNDPLDPLRDKLRKSITQIGKQRCDAAAEFKIQSAGKPPLLYVIFKGGGGTVLTNRDLMSRISQQEPVLLLETGPDSWSLYCVSKDEQIVLDRFWFSQTWSAQHESDQEREKLFGKICKTYDVGLVHFRHLIGLSPEIPRLAKGLRIPVVYSIHDYHPFCPMANLIDASGHFCRADCRKNFLGKASYPDCRATSIWGITESFRNLRDGGVINWRQRFQAAFEHCDLLITTSRELEKLLVEKFESTKAKIRVIEHGRDLDRHNHEGRNVDNKESMPIVFLGHLTEAKGAKLISQLLTRNEDAGVPFVFHFFGWIDPDLILPEKGLIKHGKYKREDLPRLLAEINPAAVLIPSIWPETFCHTLTEAWANGIPVLATNLGALKERIEIHGGGWLLKPHDAGSWWGTLCQCLDDPQTLESKREQIAKIQFRSTDAMAQKYAQIYKQLMGKKDSSNQAGNLPS